MSCYLIPWVRERLKDKVVVMVDRHSTEDMKIRSIIYGKSLLLPFPFPDVVDVDSEENNH